jgi:hypothetical protein
MGEWMYRSILLTSALVGGEWWSPGHFDPWGKSPQYPLYRRLGGPQPVQTIWRSENSWPYQDSELSPIGCPARNQLLYQVCYSGSLSVNKLLKFNFEGCYWKEHMKNVNIDSDLYKSCIHWIICHSFHFPKHYWGTINIRVLITTLKCLDSLS